MTSRRCRGSRLLVEVDPDQGERGPRPPEEERRQVRALLDGAYDVPKREFRPRGRHPKAAQVIDRIQRHARR